MKALLLIILGLIPVIASDEEFEGGIRQLSADIYSEMRKTESGNFLACPMSIATILALVHSGARDNTAEQLSTALHITPESLEKRNHETFTPLEVSDHYSLSIANAIYIKNDFEIKDEFKSTAINSFGSEVLNIDFSETQEAVDEINKWVEEKTHNEIKDLLSPADLNEDTRVVLVNAIFFKGVWEKKFKEYDTKKKPFHVNAQTEIDVDLMSQSNYFNYYENADLNAKFLEMEYEGGDLSMIFVLPNDIEGLQTLEEDHIADIVKTPAFNSEFVDVEIPKFKVESTIQFNPTLQALGIVDAFEDNATFSEINEVPLKIDKVIQKTLIEVQEERTTAAAATGLQTIEALSNTVWFSKLPPKEFKASHPFIYILKLREAILFIGRYKDPVNY